MDYQKDLQKEEKILSYDGYLLYYFLHLQYEMILLFHDHHDDLYLKQHYTNDYSYVWSFHHYKQQNGQFH